MLLNCDMGESYGAWTMGADADVMPHIDLANIACGFHAGDPAIMQRTIVLAVAAGVKVGAHPAYPDLAGFGRRSLAFPDTELLAILHYQIGAMQAMCRVADTPLHHVKPHGALYNDMQTSEPLFRLVCQAVANTAPEAKLLTLARPDQEYWRAIAAEYQVDVLFEAFADRAYEDSGQLRSRALPGAVLADRAAILAQVNSLASSGRITTFSGNELALPADTICVHGDNPESIATVAAIRESLTTLRA